MPKARVIVTTLIPKTPAGIKEFDEFNMGGLPESRPTLIAGNAGCGKTLFGMSLLVRLIVIIKVDHIS